MKQDNVIKRTIKISAIITITGIIIFAALASINWYLVIGWMMGSVISLTTYLITIFLYNALFKKGRTWSNGFWLSWGSSWIILLFNAAAMISVIAINNACSGYSLMDGTLDSALGPIHIFTYIGALGIIPVATMLAHIKRKDK